MQLREGDKWMTILLTPKKRATVNTFGDGARPIQIRRADRIAKRKSGIGILPK
jgi:hypothetical protein